MELGWGAASSPTRSGAVPVAATASPLPPVLTSTLRPAGSPHASNCRLEVVLLESATSFFLLASIELAPRRRHHLPSPVSCPPSPSSNSPTSNPPARSTNPLHRACRDAPPLPTAQPTPLSSPICSEEDICGGLMEALGSEEDICGGHSLAPIQAPHFMYDVAPLPPGLSSTFPSAARL